LHCCILRSINITDAVTHHDCVAWISIGKFDGFQKVARIWLANRSEKHGWEPLENLQDFLPDYWKNPPAEALRAGHGGGDWWEVQDFVDAIREERESPIGIDLAMDMTLPGLVSQASISQGATWVAVPDSRNWT